MGNTYKDNDKRSDRELVNAANKGQEDAMKELFLRYREWVYGLAWRLCRNREDASDVLQEVFAYFFNRFPGFALRSQIKTFLYPVVRNISLNHIRKRRRVVPLDESFAERIPDETFDSDVERKKLEELLDGLQEEEQELVLLRFYDGFSLMEIAEIMKVPLGTIKSRLHRTLAHLRKHFQEN